MTLGDLFLAGQVTVRLAGCQLTEECSRMIREVRDSELVAPFAIQSAWVFNCRYCPVETTCPTPKWWRQLVHVWVYDTPLQSDAQPPIGTGRSNILVFAKDLRRDVSRTPLDVATYGRWVFYSSEDFRQIEAEDNSATEAAATRCFIATAAFGSCDCPEVTALRAFRDRSLCSSAIGRLGVEIYYRTSPMIAARVARSPVMKSIIRTIISVVVVCLPGSDTPGSLKRPRRRWGSPRSLEGN